MPGKMGKVRERWLGRFNHLQNLIGIHESMGNVPTCFIVDSWYNSEKVVTAIWIHLAVCQVALFAMPVWYVTEFVAGLLLLELCICNADLVGWW